MRQKSLVFLSDGALALQEELSQHCRGWGWREAQTGPMGGCVPFLRIQLNVLYMALKATEEAQLPIQGPQSHN